jgi:hypothetical protein
VLREEAIKRIVERDGKTRAEAEKRIDSQITNSQRAQARQGLLCSGKTRLTVLRQDKTTLPSLQQCALCSAEFLYDCSGYGSKFIRTNCNANLHLVRCTYSLSLILIFELLGSVPDTDP